MTRPLSEARPARWPRLLAAVLLAAILVGLLASASILIGSRPVGPAEIMALVSGQGSEDVRTLVGEVRLPRTLAGLLVGAALAWAGALMQAMTRNPLADPGLLGVGSGAAFAVTIGMSWLGLRSALGIAASAIIGAAAVTTVVLILGLRGRADGSRLILAGVAFSMTISGIQSAITLLNPRALDAMRAWSAGSLASPDREVIALSLPVLAAGALIALLLVRPMDALALGDDLARGLGSHPLATRAGTGLAAVCLVGAATAIAGPIGFIGLMVPHIVRPFTGPRTAPLLLISAFTGAGLVLTADILSRIILWPGEIPVGVVCAALGALAMLVLLRRHQ
ncbi:iron ABC transporter permease [Pseudoglutamicibacter albus]|uniref:FecCD family ABC transporter permease n=1 Tax=Pseudoglutamicibacter albus TaxID=98671 RepID=UPI000C7919BD|nr:iron ABC transporter permease [Pseudoglutamicibacter albus]PKY79725.1 iron ABC transporter permease [Pseudoglutamicibacter albus]WIK83492.1 iron ABC transporter permease [Pseudoglutamicibacter albus]